MEEAKKMIIAHDIIKEPDTFTTFYMIAVKKPL
jgi:hypothetical protein